MARSILKKALVNSVIWSLSLAIFSCQPETPLSDAHGNLNVLIPMVAKNLGNDSSQLQKVTIKNISSLKSVSGSYVQFYYTPGSTEGALTGAAPNGRFIKTGDGVYVPSDTLTQQMFALYYHVQNLNDLSAEISPELKQTTPFQIGLQTRVAGNSATGLNNAFFDGETNALLFVPYNLQNIPITVNSGIIAHEFFHSIFYKKVLKNFNLQQEALVKAATDKVAAKKLFYFNQTYIRGINEGLADFWGWIYTNNADYISISLPKFGGERKLDLEENLIGMIETDGDIENQVIDAQDLSNNPTEYLSRYIYHVGTPHARFLKALTVKMATENKVSMTTAKLEVARSVYSYLKNLSATTSAFKSTDAVKADDLFTFFAQPQLSGLTLNTGQCDFVLKYVDTKNAKVTLCQGTPAESEKTSKGPNE